MRYGNSWSGDEIQRANEFFDYLLGRTHNGPWGYPTPVWSPPRKSWLDLCLELQAAPHNILASAPRRKVFVSYHHGGDRFYYEWFDSLFSKTYEIVRDHSVDQEIDSEDADYVMRRIRERYLTGATVTIVLCGRDTHGRKYVDWEILASLNQQMGLLGVLLPTNPPNFFGNYHIPARLADNVSTGYARLVCWDDLLAHPASLGAHLENAIAASKRLLDNRRPRMLRNAPAWPSSVW